MDKILKHMAMLKIKTRLNNDESALLKKKSNLMNDESIFFVDDGDSDNSSDEDEDNVDVCLVDCDLAKFYNNATEVVRQFEARRPLSVVKLHNEEGFYCVLKKNLALQLQCRELAQQTVSGMSYHVWEVTNDTMRMPHNTEVAHYCILLPKLSRMGLEENNGPAISTP